MAEYIAPEPGAKRSVPGISPGAGKPTGGNDPPCANVGEKARG